MWQISSSRKSFIEYVIGGSREVLEKNDAKQNPSDLFTTDGLLDQIALTWETDPSDKISYPVLAVVEDGRTQEILRIVASSPNSPYPFSSFCRLVSKTEFDEYLKFKKRRLYNQRLISAVIGMSFSEALLYSEKKLKSSELTPAICKRTLSYTFAKALAIVPLDSKLPGFIEGWIEAYSLIGSSDRSTSVIGTVHSSTDILKLAKDLLYGKKAEGDLYIFCQALLGADKGEIEKQWKILARKLPVPITIAEFQAKNREERGEYYQDVLNLLYSKDDKENVAAATCAFLATQIAPDSLEHIDVLIKHPDPKLVLWYGFLALLQSQGSVLRAWESMPVRLLRDLNNSESFYTAPRADISLEELRLVSKLGNDGLAKKLGQSNEIQVEILPLVTASFRYVTRSNRNFENQNLVENEREMLVYELQRQKDLNEDTSRRIFGLMGELERVALNLSKRSAGDSMKKDSVLPKRRY